MLCRRDSVVNCQFLFRVMRGLRKFKDRPAMAMSFRSVVDFPDFAVVNPIQMRRESYQLAYLLFGGQKVDGQNFICMNR